MRGEKKNDNLLLFYLRIPKDTLAVRVYPWSERSIDTIIIGQPPLDIAPNKVSLTYIYAVFSSIVSLFTV